MIPRILLLGAAALFMAVSLSARADVVVNDNGVRISDDEGTVIDSGAPPPIHRHVIYKGAGSEMYRRGRCLVERHWADGSYQEQVRCRGGRGAQAVHTHQSVVIQSSP